jgi:hypothetical protein
MHAMAGAKIELKLLAFSALTTRYRADLQLADTRMYVVRASSNSARPRSRGDRVMLAQMRDQLAVLDNVEDSSTSSTVDPPAGAGPQLGYQNNLRHMGCWRVAMMQLGALDASYCPAASHHKNCRAGAHAPNQIHSVETQLADSDGDLTGRRRRLNVGTRHIDLVMWAR